VVCVQLERIMGKQMWCGDGGAETSCVECVKQSRISVLRACDAAFYKGDYINGYI
jgi:hypothetical protein